MSDRLTYVDSSAFVKLVVEEAESAALRAHLGRRGPPIAAALLRTEVLRATMRVSHAHAGDARRALAAITLIDVDRPLIDRAGELTPPGMRSLDAIHIAAALSLGDDLGEFVTYDPRQGSAALEWGLSVVSPR